MRRLIFLALPLLAAACAQTKEVSFQDPSGRMAAACGPLSGLSVAVHEAHDGCVEAYKNAGWVRVDERGPALAQAPF